MGRDELDAVLPTEFLEALLLVGSHDNGGCGAGGSVGRPVNFGAGGQFAGALLVSSAFKKTS